MREHSSVIGLSHGEEVYTPIGGASGPDFAGPPRATLRFSVLLYGVDRMGAVDRATDTQPVVRPVPRSGRAVATYVLKMKDRVEYRNATKPSSQLGRGTVSRAPHEAPTIEHANARVTVSKATKVEYPPDLVDQSPAALSQGARAPSVSNPVPVPVGHWRQQAHVASKAARVFGVVRLSRGSMTHRGQASWHVLPSAM